MKLTPIAEALTVRVPAWAHRMLHASPRVIVADESSRNNVERFDAYWTRPGTLRMPTLPRFKEFTLERI